MTLFKFIFRSGTFACAALPVVVGGHFILQHSGASGYSDASFKSSIAVGAVGGCLMAAPMLALYWLIEQIQPLDFLSMESNDIEEAKPNEESSKRKEGLKRGGFSGICITLAVVQFFLLLGSVVVLGAGSGAIGAAILRATNHNTLEVIRATRAGAIGAAVLGPGAIVLVLLLVGFCGGSVVLFMMISKKKGSDNAS